MWAFARRFLFPELVLLVAEIVVVGFPIHDSFSLDETQQRLLYRVAPIATASCVLVWVLALRSWLLPLSRAIRRRAKGDVLDAASREAAARAILRFPIRTLALRTVLFAVAGVVLPLLLHLRAGFPPSDVAVCAAIATAHGFGVSVFRSLWYRRILDGARAAILPDFDDLRRFAGSYKQRMLLATTAIGTIGTAAIALFGWYFLPLNLEHFLRLETYFPLTICTLGVLWLGSIQPLFRHIDSYLMAALSARPAEHPARDDPRAVAAFRSAQTMPYVLALSKLAARLLGLGLLVLQAVWLYNIDVENAALLAGEGAVLSVGLALYEALWHRAAMRPLLTHIAARHRPSPDTVRTPLSLRTRMLLGFGVLTLSASGLSLFWSFTQYKVLATVFIQRESELRLDGILAELQARPPQERTEAAITAALGEYAKRFAPVGATEDHVVLYYLPPDSGARPRALGGGTAGPPPMPWSAEALLRRRDRGVVELSALKLTGAYARLYVDNHDFGAIALLLPGYRGRGPSTVPQIRVLLIFFIVLLVASLGIVVLIATDLTGPIRELERRADAMARGDLTRPVVGAAGEGDEVGRLSFAFEEMRRALNDKLRSSTEINLSLEAEVTRRTAELERRNHELKSALEQLERAQDELVRSEKMASMGRLVAGIAHEINNPVNAVVNTVGPLESTLDDLVHGDGNHDATIADSKEMLRVIKRGATRTKEIVQALHNYSRGDDDRLLDLDLHRAIDETLDLLRHHIKNGITVERDFGHGWNGRLRGRSTLNQVFMNLLTNAAQALGNATPEHPGVIRIRTSLEDKGDKSDKADKVVVEISDNGPGIPPDVLPRIFDPFFTTKDVGEGSGLGLSIVHGIVERHGGSIAVHSELGHGTRFVVTLPSTLPSTQDVIRDTSPSRLTS